MRRALALLLSLALWGPVAAQEGAEDNSFTISGAHLRYLEAGDLLVFDEGVSIDYRDLTLKGTKVTVDTETDEAQFEGEVRLEGRGQELTGEGLRVRLRERSWRAERAFTTLSPEYFEGNVVEPLYLRGVNLRGSRDLITVESPTFTSCDLAQPHYSIRARKAEIRPGELSLIHISEPTRPY